MLHDRCIQAEAEKDLGMGTEGTCGLSARTLAILWKFTFVIVLGKKKGVAEFQIGGVTVNASAVFKREQELDALFESLPDSVEARRKYRLATRLKNSQWTVPWTAKDDAMLLIGVYEQGFGNWEAMKLDISLGLGDKVWTMSVSEFVLFIDKGLHVACSCNGL